MKIIHLVSQAGLALAAVCLLLDGNRPATAQSAGMRSVDFDGVSFRYDASLAGEVVPKLVPEFVVTGGSGVWMARPRHIEFALTDFHGSSHACLPTIDIFPVRSDYRSLNPGDNHDYWLPQVKALQDLLAKRPDLRSMAEQLSSSPASPPTIGLLPPVNAANIPVGKLSYLNFRNGSGIRYLVLTAQDVPPPEPDNVCYTFQGLTGDGKNYVAAYFPAFPASMQPIEVFQGNDVSAYYLSMLDRFGKIGNDAYRPNLDLLDKMIGSLAAQPQSLDNLPGMPPTGVETAAAQYAGRLMIIALSMLGAGLQLVRRGRQA